MPPIDKLSVLLARIIVVAFLEKMISLLNGFGVVLLVAIG